MMVKKNTFVDLMKSINENRQQIKCSDCYRQIVNSMHQETTQ